MKQYQKNALALCSLGIGNGRTKVPVFTDDSEWTELIRFSTAQNLLPLIFDTASKYGLMTSGKSAELKDACTSAVQRAIRQIIQTNEFLTLLLHAQEKGLDPIVIKGVVCRDLYPQPCLRPSVDEDILVPVDDTERYHEFLLAEGLFADEAELTADERKKKYELSYHKENSPTYIELHKNLFDPDSKIFGNLNDLFEGMTERTIHIQVEDVSVRTLAPTDHLLYLILHAYKHFLHSGAGIRPICDIGLFADRYAEKIDWREIREKLLSVNAFCYAKALFRIIQLYLLPEAGFFTQVEDWNIEKIDVDPLLKDSLASGVHGASSMTRLHSSNMTLHAAGMRGRKGGIFQAVRHSIFLPLGELRNHYIYLKRNPFLLPVAWVHRVVRYIMETRNKDILLETDNSVSGSIRLGRERIRLLRKYKIIE